MPLGEVLSSIANEGIQSPLIYRLVTFSPFHNFCFLSFISRRPRKFDEVLNLLLNCNRLRNILIYNLDRRD